MTLQKYFIWRHIQYQKNNKKLPQLPTLGSSNHPIAVNLNHHGISHHSRATKKIKTYVHQCACSGSDDKDLDVIIAMEEIRELDELVEEIYTTIR